MADDQLVKIAIQFKEGEDLPSRETMWAVPVSAHEGGGTYRLENTSFMVALAAGDVVRCELDGDGMLQVVDIVEPADALLTVFQPSPNATPEAVNALVDAWQQAGAGWTEGGGPFLITVWPGLTGADVADRLNADQEAGRGEWVAAAEPDDRRRAAQTDIDFELDREQHFPPVETTYWAADDPYWADHGLDDPEYLAHVQHLAGNDQRVARALERGQQERVVTYVSRITAPDQSTLPPLDGPIFDE